MKKQTPEQALAMARLRLILHASGLGLCVLGALLFLHAEFFASWLGDFDKNGIKVIGGILAFIGVWDVIMVQFMFSGKKRQ